MTTADKESRKFIPPTGRHSKTDLKPVRYLIKIEISQKEVGYIESSKIK